MNITMLTTTATTTATTTTTTTRLLLLAEDASASALRLDGTGRATPIPAPTPGTPWPAPAPGERTILAVPGQRVRAQWLPLAAHSDAQARALALASMAGDLAARPEDTHVALAPRPGSDAPCLVLAASREDMARWLDEAQALGVQPDRMVPDYLLLAATEPFAVASLRNAWVVRGAGIAFAAEPTLAEQVLATIEGAPAPRVVPFEASVLVPAIDPMVPDLRQGEFLPRGAGRRLQGSRRRMALWAALLLASPLLLTLTEGLVHRARTRANDAIATTIATRLGVDPGGRDAAPALARERALLESGERFASRTGAVFAAVEAQPGAMLERIDYTAQAMEAVVRHRDPDAAERIAASLQQSGFRIQAAAGARSGDLQFTTLRIEGNP